jgi:hypothetical protein
MQTQCHLEVEAQGIETFRQFFNSHSDDTVWYEILKHLTTFFEF